MPEPTQTTQGTEQSSGQTASANPNASDGQGQEEEFDKPRAMATIQKLREFEKTAKAQIAAYEKSQADAKKASDAAEKARLTEAGEYKALAEQAQAKVTELEPHKAKAERYEASLKKLLDRERKDLPKHVLTLLDKLDPADQLDYIAENREVLTAKPQQTPPNINGTAGAGGAKEADPKAREADLRARFRI